jgi:hypothetical protein
MGLHRFFGSVSLVSLLLIIDVQRALRLDKEKPDTSDTRLSSESRRLEITLTWPSSERLRAELDPGEASTGPLALWDEAARF